MPHLYAAPLEGVTTAVWRQAHRTVFGGADKYYTPFLTPENDGSFTGRDLREIAGNESDLVPQLLTNKAETFIKASAVLEEMGYDEVNLNLGCPSGTVVSKHKGSGMLDDPVLLERFLESIFTKVNGIHISIKTRIGLKDAAEWPTLLRVYEQYPIYELTVHPRVQKQLYRGEADRNVFLDTLRQTTLPLVYNGDIRSDTDPALHYGCAVMVGRGLVAVPDLFRVIRGGNQAAREELTSFHQMILDGYRQYMPGETALLYRMRELWTYLQFSFTGTEKPMKQMKKAKDLSGYTAAAEEILNSCPLNTKT